MAKKRLRSTQATLRIQKEEVKLFMDTLNSLQKDFLPREKQRDLRFFKLEANTNNKYHKMIANVCTYLKEIRGDYTNPLELMIDDWCRMVFNKIVFYRRQWQITDFVLSASNQIAFEGYISNHVIKHSEEYWMTKEIDLPEIRKNVNKLLMTLKKEKMKRIKEQSFYAEIM